MTLSSLQQQLETKNKEYERLKQWSIQQLAHLKGELNTLIQKQENTADSSLGALQSVIREQDSLIQFLTDDNENQKQQIEALISQIQEDSKKFVTLQDEMKEYAKNSQLIKEEMSVCNANRPLNISDINSEKLREVTSSAESPEQLCPSKLISQQNLLRLSEAKVQALAKQNQTLKAQINKYKELLTVGSSRGNSMAALSNGNEFVEKQKQIIGEQQKQILKLTDSIREQRRENSALQQQLEQMQLSSRDIEALNTEIIQLEYKANNIKNSIEQNHLLNSSGAFHKSISNSQSAPNSLMFQSLTVQQLQEQLQQQKQINKCLNQQLYDLQVGKINTEAVQFYQLKMRVTELETMLKQKQQEAHMKQKMILELNNMVSILQHENAVLKAKL